MKLFPKQSPAFVLSTAFLLAGPVVPIAPILAQQNDSPGTYYRCVDAYGRVEFKNTGDTKGCEKRSAEPNIVPGMAKPQAKPEAAPANFPKVDAQTQKARDTDRRRILEEELRAEEKKLADLKKEFNEGQPERRGDERNYQKYLDRVEQLKGQIAQSENNIKSIKTELGKLP